jgi:hypothetical protein
MEGKEGRNPMAVRYLRLDTRMERGQRAMVQVFFDDQTGKFTHGLLCLEQLDGSWGAPYQLEVRNGSNS